MTIVSWLSLSVMDTQETKEAGITPLQSMQVKIEKLELSFDWLKWSLLAGFAAIGLCFTAVFFTIRDTKQDLKQDIQRLESGISENRKLLIELIQKQAGAGPQETSKASQQDIKQTQGRASLR